MNAEEEIEVVRRKLLRLRADWRHLLRHAWSVRFSLLATLLSGIEAGASALSGAPPFSITVYAALMCVITIAAALARLVAQKNIEGE